VLRRKQSIYLYLGLGLALAIGAIVSLTIVASTRENESSRETQETVVKYETEHILSALSGKLTTMIYWQDAYDKAAANWDQKWVDYQFGPYLDAIDINAVAMFDARGKLLFSYTHGLTNPPTRARLAANQNILELFRATKNRKSIRPPHIETATLDLDGTPYFAVAGFITPETDTQMPIPEANRRVVIFLTRATTASYATLAKSFNVSDLKIANSIPDTNGFINVMLKDAGGDTATRVWWRPARPGAKFLGTVVPLSILIFLLLATVQTVVIRNWQSLQHALYKAEAKADSAVEESRAKSAFLGTISHELRTPLNAIIGFSDVLLKKMFGALGSPRYEEYAGYISSSGHSLLDKVNDLIEIARIEAHDTAIDRIPTDAEAMARAAMEGMREAAQQKNITLALSTGSRGLWCQAAPLSLQKVLSRVLDNAIKFSHAGGAVEIDLTQDKTNVVIEIRDRGIGIAAEDLKNLGKPFVQVEGHMARRNSGVGLGLAISKGLMKLMDGSLEITSEIGCRTTVTLRLPAVPAPHGTQQKAA
jgi:signal transduction histidine kinase